MEHSDGSHRDPAARVVAPELNRTAANPLWNVVLFAATLLTSTWAGAAHLGIDLVKEPGRWVAGVPYALALLTILGIHELGHYLTARRRGIHVSLPYFIPAPSSLGTFGAFIQMRGDVRDRATYFDVAIAGPLAGLVAAILALVIGLGREGVAPHGDIIPASSALFAAIYASVGGDSLREPLILGPLAFAGYLGLVITALNLAPIGQLDGGHVAYALLGPARARTLANAVILLLVAGGLFYSRHLLMWGIIAWLVAGRGHPQALDEAAPLGRGRVLAGWAALLLLLVIVLPWPL